MLHAAAFFLCALICMLQCCSMVSAATREAAPATTYEEFDFLSSIKAQKQLQHSYVDASYQQANIAFVKPTSVAGTSVDNVLRRYAIRHGMNGYSMFVRSSSGKGARDKQQEPLLLSIHGVYLNAFEKQLASLTRPVVKITSTRHPVDRVLSFYFSTVIAREGKAVANSKTGYSISGFRSVLNTRAKEALDLYITQNPGDSPEQVFASYDLVIVVEQFDASLVLLSRVLKTALVDMTYGRPAGSQNSMKKKRFDRHSLPTDIETLLQVSDFLNSNQKDIAFFELANGFVAQELKSDTASIQLTETSDKKVTVKRALEKFLTWQQALQEACPIPEERTQRSCLRPPDHGCNFECMEQYLASSSINAIQSVRSYPPQISMSAYEERKKARPMLPSMLENLEEQRAKTLETLEKLHEVMEEAVEKIAKKGRYKKTFRESTIDLRPDAQRMREIRREHRPLHMTHRVKNLKDKIGRIEQGDTHPRLRPVKLRPEEQAKRDAHEARRMKLREERKGIRQPPPPGLRGQDYY